MESMESMQRRISVSVLSVKEEERKDVVRKLEQSGADWVHWDIIDPTYRKTGEPALEVSAQIKALHHVKKAVTRNSDSKLFWDVHIMTREPETWVSQATEAGADGIVFHPKDCAIGVLETLALIKACEKRAGLALSPGDAWKGWPAEWLRASDMLVVMGVVPGAGGQPLLKEQIDVLRDVRVRRESEKLGFLMSFDGGVTQERAAELWDAGADVLVSGNYIVSHPVSMMAAIKALRHPKCLP